MFPAEDTTKADLLDVAKAEPERDATVSKICRLMQMMATEQLVECRAKKFLSYLC